MFCSQCGYKIQENARCCANCGCVQTVEKDPSLRSVPKASGTKPKSSAGGLNFADSGNKSRVVSISLAVAGVLVSCLGLMPLFAVNVPFVGGSFSLGELHDALLKLDSSSLGGLFPEGVTDGMGFLGLLLLGLMIVVALSFVAGIVNLVRTITGKPVFAIGFVLSMVVGFVAIATTMALNNWLSDFNILGQTVSGTFSPSIWAWIMTVVSAIGAVACRFLGGDNEHSES